MYSRRFNLHITFCPYNSSTKTQWERISCFIGGNFHLHTFLSLQWHPSTLPRSALAVARSKVVFSRMVVILCVFYSFIFSKQFFFGTLEQAVTSEQCHYHMDGGSRTCGAHVSGQAALESIITEHRTGTSSSLGTAVSHCKAVSWYYHNLGQALDTC